MPEDVRSGPSTVLTAAEETALASYIKLMASIGYPLTRRLLCCEVKKILDLDGRVTPFVDNLPGTLPQHMIINVFCFPIYAQKNYR